MVICLKRKDLEIYLRGQIYFPRLEFVIFQLCRSLCLHVSAVCRDVLDASFIIFSSAAATHCGSTPCPRSVIAAVLCYTKIVPGPVCSSWWPLYLISLVTANQSVSLARMPYLSTHSGDPGIFLCFCTKVTPVNSITFLISIIHFQ